MGDYKLIRTGTMDWQADPEIPGFKQQVLLRDTKRKSVVRKWFVPPAWGTDSVKGKPDRHYHMSVYERAYNLDGDFPHWEYSNVADFKGDMIVFRRHTAMDRAPGSLHGLAPKPQSQAGAEILYWNTGPGTSIREKGFEKETINVPFDKKARVARDTFTPCRLMEVDKMPWQRHPRVTGLKIRPLMTAVLGAGATSVVNVPADWMPMAAVTAETEPGEAAWLYVLNGDVRLKIAGAETTYLTLVENDFLAWRAPTVVGFGQGEASDGGATVVCTGHALG